MYLKIVLLLLFLIQYFGHAQNLVPNPSFEDTLECPDFPGQVWRAEGWHIATSTPDYYNCCCNYTHPVCGVPDNIFSHRFASTGNAYCGLGTYARSNPPNFQEKIGTRLISPLELGVRYYVSMKVSSVSSSIQGVNGACNKLGILFSTSMYDLNNVPPSNNYAQFYSDSIINDTVNWINIEGSFISDSAYEYLTIGNFFDNNNIDTLRYWYFNGNQELVAYYFIDDICVTADTNWCIFNQVSNEGCRDFAVGNIVPQLPKIPNFYPNPADDYIKLESDILELNSIELYTISDQLLVQQKLKLGNATICTALLPNGIYYLKTKTKELTHFQKIIINHP